MEKFKVTFEANDQQLKSLGTKHASDTYADIEATFILGNRWTDMDSVSAVWWNDFTKVATVLDSQGKCIVPHEVLTRKGCVRVNLVGSIVDGDELVTRLTSYSAEAVQVNEKIKLTGSETSEITPSQYEQFVANVKADADRAEAGADEAEQSAQSASESATASDNSASDSARSAAASAESAQNASESAQNAENAKDDAESARDKILSMRATASTLPAGSDATASYSDGLLTLGIPRGDKGVKGDTGETGATPNISIGTVSTLEPTEDATASITGTAGNPVLNLGIPKGDKGEDGDVTRSEFNDLKSDLSGLATHKQSVNLYDGGYVTGYIVTDGSVNPTSGYTCSTVQNLKAGTYIFKYSAMFGSNAMRCYRYNADNSLKDIVYGEDVGSGICKFTISENSLGRFNIGDSSTPATWMIVEGESASDYPDSYVAHVSYYEIKDTVKIPSYNANPLYGKKLCCDGDSIMYGAGFVGGFAKIIAENNGMTLQNIAVSGATIRSGTTWSGGGNRHWICESIANLDADGDYYIFDGWVNDVNSQTVIGSVSWGYSATLDTTTFCGAFEQCCKTLATMFAGKKVGYVFTHRIWKPTDTLVQSYIDKMIEILNKWGIPYINLMELDPPINEIASLKSAYTKDGDGWHPNEQGYKLFYVDKITAWMKTL